MIVQVATIAGAAQFSGTPTDTAGALMNFQPAQQAALGADWAPVIFGWNYNSLGAAQTLVLDIRPTAGSAVNLQIPIYSSGTSTFNQAGQHGGSNGCLVVPFTTVGAVRTPYVINFVTTLKDNTGSLTIWWAWRQVG